MKQWLTANTIVPTWVPKALRQEWTLYVATFILQIIATAITGLILLAIPNFTFRGALLIIGASAISHILGFGPGIVASLFGASFINYFLTPPNFAISLDKAADVMATIAYLAVCLITAWLARGEPSMSATQRISKRAH